MDEKETVVQDVAVTDETEVIADDTVTTKKSKKTMMIVIVIAAVILVLALVLVLVLQVGKQLHSDHCADQRLQTSLNISAKIDSTLTPILGRYNLTETEVEVIQTDDYIEASGALEHIDIRANGFGKLGPDEARELFHDLEEAANALDFTDCDVTVEDDPLSMPTSAYVDSIRIYPNMTTDQYYFFVENSLTAFSYGLVDSRDAEFEDYVKGIYFYDGSQYACLAEYPYGWSGERKE